MDLDAKARRRWFGASVLLAAVVMLLAGETVLQGRLSPLAFACYWIVCFLLTGLAMIIAVMDARSLAQRTVEEHRDLLRKTLDTIEAEVQHRAHGASDGDRAP